MAELWGDPEPMSYGNPKWHWLEILTAPLWLPLVALALLILGIGLLGIILYDCVDQHVQLPWS